MTATIAYRSIKIPETGSTTGAETEPVSVFYREAGPVDAPAVLLLHGFPTSSHMFRGLIPALADKYRVIAPDLPGFGMSDAPDAETFTYSFDHLAEIMTGFTDQIGLDAYALYVFDYGAPVGLRMALSHPERITALITQNGNAYEEGLSGAWSPIQAYWKDPSEQNRANLRGFLARETTVFQYTHGVDDAATRVAPEAITLDQHGLDRPGSVEAQLDLFRDYASNVALYPAFQSYFRTHRPPTLAVWGANDPFFVPEGAHAFQRDNPDAEIHFVNSGHFPLETNLDEVAAHIRHFLARALDLEQGVALFGVLSEATSPEAAKPGLAAMRGVFGFVPNLGLALAVEPAVLDTYLTMLKALSATALDPLAQQVAMAAASRVNQAEYGIAVHTTLAAQLGASADIVAALRDGHALPDARLEAVRRFAAALAENRAQAGDADVTALRAAGYGADAAVAIALAVAAKTLVNAVAHLARPEIDPGFQSGASGS